jgi:hypothetical protein
MHMSIIVMKKLLMYRIVQSHRKLNFGLLFLCMRQVCTGNYNFFELNDICFIYDYLDYIYEL